MATQSTDRVDHLRDVPAEQSCGGHLVWAVWMVLAGAVSLAVGCGCVVESIRQHIALYLPHLGRPVRLGAQYLIELPGPEAFARIPVFLLVFLAPWVLMAAWAIRLHATRSFALTLKFVFTCIAITLWTVALSLVVAYAMLEPLIPLVPVLPDPHRASSARAVAILTSFILLFGVTAVHTFRVLMSSRR